MTLLLTVLIAAPYHEPRINPKRRIARCEGSLPKPAQDSCRRATAPRPTGIDRNGRTLAARFRSGARNASYRRGCADPERAAASKRTARDLCRADRGARLALRTRPAMPRG